MEKITKIELGLIVTVVLALLAGANYIGVLKGKIDSLEQDKDFQSIINLKNDSLKEIQTSKDLAVKSIDESTEEINNELSRIRSELSGSIVLISKSKSCPEQSTQLGNFAIGVERQNPNSLRETQKITGDTSWDLSQNFDGRLFKACVFK